MPANARIIGSPGYREGIDGGLYDLDQAELQAVHERTRRQSGEQVRQIAINYDIPIGQQVHAFRELRERLWPNHRKPSSGAPKTNDWLDQMTPGVKKRTRERHFKTFAIVSTSNDWPDILATTNIEIIGMESILAAARAFSPRSKRKRVRMPHGAMRKAGGSP